MADQTPPTLAFTSQKSFEKWLERNFEAQAGLWIKFAKKGSGVPSVNYAEALEVALCFGWIDGQAKRVDETYYVQRWTPRRKRSMWSKINREKALALIEAGRMRPSGQAEIDRAREDGRWDAAYSGSATALVPDDIANDPEASKNLAGMNAANRYAYLHRFMNAKREQTKAKLLQQLREGHRFY
ncbi:YdeI/OmpD-associated family protein [Rhizocola hellebori]|uniref:YdeI/OmpD-associated family protein n=1 Tax=Rhizocola hellebori TaxID=1392758 RepID=UPI0019444984|nr:YdeI/OmpD-associated family protein [Rhizocola hellebori]